MPIYGIRPEYLKEGEEINGVTLITSGSATDFLNGTGNYTAAPVDSLAITNSTVNSVTLTNGGSAANFLNEQGNYTTLSSIPTAYGQIYEEGNTTATTISTIDVFEMVGTTTVLNPLNLLCDSPQSGRLRYTGTDTIVFLIEASCAVTSAVNNQFISIQIEKNGTKVVGTLTRRKVANGSDQGNLSTFGIVSMSQNDYIELFVANNTSTANLTFETMSLRLTNQ